MQSFIKVLSAILFAGLFPIVAAAQKTDKLLSDLLRKNPELFGPILQDPAKYDVQIIYTQINRDPQNRPVFRSYYYRYDRKRYVYPASTVKFPAVLVSLEKINELKAKYPALTANTPMLTDSAYARQTATAKDPSSASGLPSVAHYAKKIFLVSSNDAFNRLYEFIGQCDFNTKLQQKGYRDTRMLHRLSVSMTADQNRHTNPVRFVENGQTIYAQPAQVCAESFTPDSSIRRGAGFMRNDSLIRQPFDFTEKNAFALGDQQEMLRAVMFPEAVPAKRRFNLTTDDYRFLYQYMSQLPRETTYPNYGADTSLHDSSGKFFMFGDNKGKIPQNIRIFNKIGGAYGYLLDNAYIVDFDKGVEFMLSAVIYCNSDGIFNDDKYDYNTIGYPFLANLGRVVYDYDVKRKRPERPDLRKFMVTYDKQQ